MIGNDVIDLALARSQSNWKRKGFLEKIFTIYEQQLILTAANSEVMVWILWSRKEAAYKIFNRETLIRSYNPFRFECSAMQFNDGFYFGEVAFNHQKYYTKTTVEKDFIHTIAVNHIDDFSRIYSPQNNPIFKKGTIPYIYSEDGKAEKPISISHHGKFKQIVSL